MGQTGVPRVLYMQLQINSLPSYFTRSDCIGLQSSSYSTRGYDISYTSQPAGGAAPPGCGGTLYGTRGVVTALGFPGNYSRYSDCTWTLRAVC